MWTLASTHQPALCRAWPSPEVCYPSISFTLTCFLCSLCCPRSFSPSCPTLPPPPLFFLSLLTCQRGRITHHMCSISCFHFLLPACAPAVVSLYGEATRGLSWHIGSLCSPISTECSTRSAHVGRMLYGVGFSTGKEREMMDGNLYQCLKLSTSSFPLAVLMSADHNDPKGQWPLFTDLTHTTHTSLF